MEIFDSKPSYEFMEIFQMSSMKIRLPVLIKQKKSKNYSIRPLLFPIPIVKHEKYDVAVKKFKKKIETQFNDFFPDLEKADILILAGLSPEFHIETKEVYVKFKKKIINGKFLLAYFTVNNIHYVCIPALDSLIMVIGQGKNKKDIILTDIILNFFRDKLKEDETEIDFNKYYYTNEFHTYIDMQLFINSPFEMIKKSSEDLSMLNIFRSFNGREEIEKVGMEWNYNASYARIPSQENAVREIEKALKGDKPPCIVILGERGSGKTSVINQALKQFHNAEYTNLRSELKSSWENVATKTWYVDPLRVIAGMSIIGYWERRFEAILDYIIHRQEDIIKPSRYYTRITKIIERTNRIKTSFYPRTDRLYIKNLPAFFRVGHTSQSKLSLADVLQVYMENREIAVIAEASPEEWASIKASKRKFTDLFYTIQLDTLQTEELIDVLQYHRVLLEKEDKIRFSNEALIEIIKQSLNTRTKKDLPSFPVNLLYESARKYGRVNENNIKYAVRKYFRFKSVITDTTRKLEQKRVKAFFDAKLVGQEEAKRSLVDIVQLVKAGFNEPKKPLASLLFIGPTGVGKTESAKLLCKYLFEDDKSFVRINMNEYISFDAVSRLIGSYSNPDGYLTSRVRQLGTCLVLFDEIEKAHSSVHDLLLQVLGEGRLTDTNGQTTDFSNTIIIMTSNLGAEEATKIPGFDSENLDKRSVYRKACEDFFRPEFLNRIDKILPFENLKDEDIEQLVQLQIAKIIKRDGFIERSLMLSIDRKALMEMTKKVIDKKYGARSLKRQLEKNIVEVAGKQLSSFEGKHASILLIRYKNESPESKFIKLQTEDIFSEARDKIYKSLWEVKEKAIIIEKIRELKERIETILEELPIEKRTLYWEYSMECKAIEEEYYNEEVISYHALTSIKTPKISFSHTRVMKKPHHLNDKHLGKEIFSYLEIEDYIKEVTYYTKTLEESFEEYDEVKPNREYHPDLVQNIKFAYMNYFVNQFRKKDKDFIIKIEAISESEESFASVEKLSSLYKVFLEKVQADTIYQNVRKENAIYIILKGPGLEKIITKEKGFHIFLRSFQVPIPIYFSYKILESETFPEVWSDNYTFSSNWQDEDNLIWKRSYAYHSAYGDNEYDTYIDLSKDTIRFINDFYSGFSVYKEPEYEDWLLMFYPHIIKEEE